MSKPANAVRLRIVAVTPAAAQRYVAANHRHHGPVPGGYAFWALACVKPCGTACGVAIVGRPTNRNSDSTGRVEVLRVATDGTPNACSALYGAAARTAKAAGCFEIVTYTLDSEPGSSLRGAGWVSDKSGIKSWWTHESGAEAGRKVKPRDHYAQSKQRWIKRLGAPVDIEWPEPPPVVGPQIGLFG